VKFERARPRVGKRFLESRQQARMLDGLGECCKLPHRDSGGNPIALDALRAQKTHLVAANDVYFPLLDFRGIPDEKYRLKKVNSPSFFSLSNLVSHLPPFAIPFTHVTHVQVNKISRIISARTFLLCL